MIKISKREKVMLAVLFVMLIGAAYYLLFLTPNTEKKASLEAEIASMDDQLVMAQARAVGLKQMQQELEAMKASDTEIKEVPPFDNSKKLMESLHLILGQAVQYTVNFSGISEEDGIVRRNVNLSYQCTTYDAARTILQNIHDGKYPCVLLDVSIGGEETYAVSASLTFFEYK